MNDEGDLEPGAVRALVRQAKAALRKRARALRGSLPLGAAAARSAAIAERLQALAPLSAARTIALFDPMIERREVDLGPVDAWARARGLTVYYPSTEPAKPSMTFREGSPSSLTDQGLGFREPAPTAPEASSVDVIIVPALLVDPRGHRLGYGGGYYDRALPCFRPPAIAVAVAFDFQLAAELPIDEHDVAVDLVVTDERTLEPRASSG